MISARDMDSKEKNIYEQSQGKATPKFTTEAKERAFWENNDTSDYVDWNHAQLVTMPNLKPTIKILDRS